MTVTAPPAAAPQGDSAGDGFRKTRCKDCDKAVTEVTVDGVGLVVVDGRSPTGEWLAVHDGAGWRLVRGPGEGVRYSEHGCVLAAAAALLLGGEPLPAEEPRPARPAPRGRSARPGANMVVGGFLLSGTEGPCGRRCGRTVPRRYGPDPTIVCDVCRSERR